VLLNIYMSLSFIKFKSLTQYTLYVRQKKEAPLRKFTLIELLVVVAIIGILTSLLLPSLTHARQVSKAAVCKSNMRQINISFTVYADDNDSHYPMTTSHTWAGHDAISWDDRLSGYDGREVLPFNKQASGKINASDFEPTYARIYKCPDDNVQREFGTDLDTIIMSYALNFRYNNNNSAMGVIGLKDGKAWSAQINGINDTTATILMAEAKYAGRMVGRYWGSGVTPSDVNNYMLDAFLHKGISGSNYMMIDGHVEYLGFYRTISGGSIASLESTLWDAQK
jgi:prepilin-type N-terminal cleavage/methylation domain-containing protein/prepilin-type processing-associated H-X9-DG protein